MATSGQNPKPPAASDPLDDWFDFGDALPPPPSGNEPPEDLSRRVTPLVVEPSPTPRVGPSSPPSDPFSLDAPDLWDWEVEPEANVQGVMETREVPALSPSRPTPKVPEDVARLARAYEGGAGPTPVVNLPVADFFDPFDALEPEVQRPSGPTIELSEVPTTPVPQGDPDDAFSFPTRRPKIPHPADIPGMLPPSSEVVEVGAADLTDGDEAGLQFDPLEHLPLPPRTPSPTLPPAVSSRKPSVRPPASRGTPAETRKELHERFDLGDFTGALTLAEVLLEQDRADRDAKRVADVCRVRLQAIYLGRLGALDQIPAVVVAPTELRWLSLDHRAGFVLSLVDGVSSLEEIVDVSSMSALEVLRTLYNLLSQRVIELRPPRGR